MQFALLGDHPDGLDMARALVESGRHQLMLYSGPALGAQTLKRWDMEVPTIHDLEEVLAHPDMDAVIVAGNIGDRPAQLRRAVQSERHVLCVHPCDFGSGTAFEAQLNQGDTGKVLMPILPSGLHPGFYRLGELIQRARDNEAREDGTPESTFPRLVEIDRWSTDTILLETESVDTKPIFPGWHALRVMGGEIAELSGFAAFPDVSPSDPVLLAGRFEKGGIFHIKLLPFQSKPYWRVRVMLQYSQAELIFPDGWPGPATLTWVDDQGQPQSESWDIRNPWPRMVELFEHSVDYFEQLPPSTDRRFEDHINPTSMADKIQQASPISGQPVPSTNRSSEKDTTQSFVSWQDEIRCLELDEAARRSIERRRSSILEYQESLEEVGFKGTMTLAGCGVLLACLCLLIIASWVPWVALIMLPLLLIFLLLQLFRWALPQRNDEKPE